MSTATPTRTTTTTDQITHDTMTAMLPDDRNVFARDEVRALVRAAVETALAHADTDPQPQSIAAMVREAIPEREATDAEAFVLNYLPDAVFEATYTKFATEFPSESAENLARMAALDVIENQWQGAAAVGCLNTIADTITGAPTHETALAVGSAQCDLERLVDYLRSARRDGAKLTADSNRMTLEAWANSLSVGNAERFATIAREVAADTAPTR